MAGKNQRAYLANLLSSEPQPTTPPAAAEPATEAAPSPPPRNARLAGSTLLGRESALARLASGEIQQVARRLVDPARVKIWSGNARIYNRLTEDNCRDLIDALIAEGAQRVAAVARRIEDDPDHDLELIVGTRRHFSVSWLRANNYPEFQLLVDVVQIDDEAAFRLADIENRARKDVSDIERARNYRAALDAHYGGKQVRMVERLKVSKGWLSKMLKVAELPDGILAAFASPDDVQLAPAYPLAQALDDKGKAKLVIEAARKLAREQSDRQRTGALPLPGPEVIRRLLAATTSPRAAPNRFVVQSGFGRDALSIMSANRQGVTIRLHAGSGASEDELVTALREALAHLSETGHGLQP
ncbi:ParB/RepB/Spo0J family partition protein [Sphingomonas sp. H39-1-10]|uniref:ParB/RepB/Spo0J family partition protein n=1 Tax=Sphingomonas pollutisoli TaxID=3030829 RepID=UPI0023B91D86|nr:ParB/RepB/Spo0J family partition protein [Sphingomonas pollutisoli]MDF0490384.1 ParB/RepB/Spo0J family partition protein [Sphingomonas pollutisoli]